MLAVRLSAIAAVQEMTQGGAESVLECLGSKSAMGTAIGIARPSGAIGYVGVPHGSGHNFNLESWKSARDYRRNRQP
ncbi:hypothetical protein [Nostoc sp.]|uniref:hypothetical protein n=1 Tax=Nostoc sp. TaxID=1180 RepID=UPI002FF8C1B8